MCCVQHVPRGWKLSTFIRKCFSGILHIFYKIRKRCVRWCYTLCLSFLWKCPIFSGEVTSGKITYFLQISTCFFCCVSSINRVNGQKLRGVATLVTEGENCNILSENFFENFVHFLQSIAPARMLMLCNILPFLQKWSIFPGGVSVVKVVSFS